VRGSWVIGRCPRRHVALVYRPRSIMMAAMTNTISAMLNKTISIVVMTTAAYLPSFVLYTRTTSVVTPLGALFRCGRLGPCSYVSFQERKGAGGPQRDPARIFAERPASAIALWVPPAPHTLRAIFARRPSTKVNRNEGAGYNRDDPVFTLLLHTSPSAPFTPGRAPGPQLGLRERPFWRTIRRATRAITGPAGASSSSAETPRRP
jgi:hypothetical protein